MEDDGVKWQSIATTTTNARGEFDVRVNAAFWDGSSDNKVEVVAYFQGDSYNKSSKSVTKDMYIHQPQYVAPKIEQDRTITSTRGTSMSLQVIDGTSTETLRIFPTFNDDAGNPIPTSQISIYVDGQYKQKVSSNDWSTSIWCGAGSHTVKAVSDTIVFGVNTYGSSSVTESFYCKPPQVITSTPKQYTQTEPIQPKVSIPSEPIFEEKQVPKFTQYDLNKVKKLRDQSLAVVKDLETGVYTAEKSLTGFVYQKKEAIDKINQAWDLLKSSQNKVSVLNSNILKGDDNFERDEIFTAENFYTLEQKSTETVGQNLIKISR